MSQKRIVVVGAGVAGLTTALLLSRNPRYQITVAAKHMPGDYDIEYASPWAGANFMPVSVRNTEPQKWDKETFPFLHELAAKHPEAGIHFQPVKILSRSKDKGSATATWWADLMSADPWWKDTVPNFKLLPQSSLPPGVDHATTFTSVCINTAIYLPWLVSQCLKASVVFKRGVFTRITDAAVAGVHHSGKPADLVLNCTGLSSRKLGGVEDARLYAARAQVVLVRNDADSMYSVSGSDDGPEELVYIMTRAAGGGTILGGCYQRDNWESQADPNLAVRIMKRCVEVCPALTGGKGIEYLDVIRHSVGLRPARDGGARIEKEHIDGNWVVHNYGHGGSGYQCSYGCAMVAVKLVDEVLEEKTKARL